MSSSLLSDPMPACGPYLPGAPSGTAPGPPAAINVAIRAAPAHALSAPPRHRHRGARNGCTGTGAGPAARHRCPHRRGLAGPRRSLVGISGTSGAGRRSAIAAGSHPMGVAVIDDERIMAMAGDGRAELSPETKRAFAAYCGKGCGPRRRGFEPREMMQDQVRHIRFDGPRRMIVALSPSVWSG